MLWYNTCYDSHCLTEYDFFLWKNFNQPGKYFTLISFSGWPRRHYVFRSQLWRWGKTPELSRPFPACDCWRSWCHCYFYCVFEPQLLVTASRALLLKQWDWRQAQCTRTWRAIHTVPVASMTFDSTSTLLATGRQCQDSCFDRFLPALPCFSIFFVLL